MVSSTQRETRPASHVTECGRIVMPEAEQNKSIVLIVDDTPTNLEVLHQLLDGNGHEVLVAIDGESALSQAAYARPDIILLDVMMPGWDGFETCRRLKESEATRDIPVIFMTALSETVDKVRGFGLGAVDYITKPLQHEEVLARVTTHLTLRQLQKVLQEHNLILEQRVAERTAELSRLIAIYQKFVPEEFLRFLEKQSILDIRLGDQVQQEMTVMFSDIQGWTSISERMSPQENFDFINEYFSVVSPVIRKHGGFIDQYYGDGIMALFSGAPEEALAAAIEIQRVLNQTSFADRFPAVERLRVGTGIHTGSVMLGIVGEDERMQGAVVSDNVNLAARLEGLTRIFSVSIMVSEQTLVRLRDRGLWNHRFVGRVQVKGKRERVAVYEICDGDPAETQELKLATRELFEEGLALYLDRKFAESSVRFNQVVVMNPEDKAARFYLGESARHMIGGVAPDWQGVVTLREK